MRRATIIGYGPVIALVAAACVIAVVILSNVIGGSGKYVAYAKFTDAGGVLKNYTVKVGNVTAGSIENIRLDRDDNVVVRMELDKGAAPIGEGASAKVRPVNLLGEKYIDLHPGDLNKPLPSGSTIPTSRTGTPIELDDLLNMLDPDTRAGLRLLVNEAGRTLAGRGTDFNGLLEEMPPALDQARAFVAQVAQENATLDRLLVRGDRIVTAMHPHRDQLGEFVTSAANALDAVADRRRQLGATVRTAPAALAQLTRTLNRVQGAAEQLAPAARSLTQTSPALAATLARTPAFARDARSTLQAAREVAPALSRLGRRSTPTLRRLQPTAQELSRFAEGIQKLLDAADQNKGLREFLGFMQGWVGVIRNADGLSHVFRLRFNFDEELFTSAITRYMAELTPKVAAKRRSTGSRRPSSGRAQEAVKRALEDLQRGLTGAAKRLPDRLKQVPEQLKQGINDALHIPAGRTGARPGGSAPSSQSSSGGVTPLLDYLLGS